MTMRLSIVAELDYRLAEPADVLLALEVVQLPDQRLIEDLLTVAGATSPLNPIPGEHGIGRRTWLTAHGRLHARYKPPRSRSRGWLSTWRASPPIR